MKQAAPNTRARLGLTALVTLWMLLTLDAVWPYVSQPRSEPSEAEMSVPHRTDYLVVAPQALRSVASAWADYRRSTGYDTEVLLLAPTQAKAAVIRQLIRQVYARSGAGSPLYVLLIGHAHPFSSQSDTFLPAAYFTVDSSRFPGYGADPVPSDDAFAGDVLNVTPGEAKQILIGRIPIRTESEGYLLLERTRAYENKPRVGEGRARIELVSSDAGFGAQYDPFFEWALRVLIEDALPDEYQWHLLSGNPRSPYSYPGHLFPREFASRFDSGALALVYIGHGQPELLGWAYSSNGTRGRIFGAVDAPLLQGADSTLGVFTACSAGKYDQSGDNISVVEATFLAPGGPVATYSSSAWINATANGRLLIDLFEALLKEKPTTLGEWAGRTESDIDPTPSRLLAAEIVKALIPRLSGIYHGKAVLSESEANQELAIQHATYNLFGDPALRIAYARRGMEISPYWAPPLRRGTLPVSGRANLPAGQRVSISLHALPGAGSSAYAAAIGTVDRYRQENDLVVASENAYVQPDGRFATTLVISPGTPAGKYSLRAVSVDGSSTYVIAHPLYIGWPSISEVLSSTLFWWVVMGAALLSRLVRASSQLACRRHT